MRLLLLNLVTDSEDPILGFTTAWIRALAREMDRLHVITMRAGHIEVPGNVRVYSVGKERSLSEPHRALVFYRHLLHLLHTERIDACFAHMIPVFSIMAAPLLRVHGIPLVTWYAHPKLTTTLKLAHHLSDRMVTSVASAYPYRQHKLTVIGQGIDTEMFAPDDTPPDDPPLILCAGRLSPVKDHGTLLLAAALLRERSQQPFRVVIIGKPEGPDAADYIAQLQQHIDDLALHDLVHFAQPVPGYALPAWYRRCTVHVNLTPAGFGDKVAWESMSCGRPCLVANTGFRETLGSYADRLLFGYQDPTALADRLRWMLELPRNEQLAIGTYLRQQVLKLHSLDNLASKLAHVFQTTKASVTQ